jgi:hypothetical protein
MSRFKKGDRVRVRFDSNLPSKGHSGTIEEDFLEGSLYIKVKLDIKEQRRIYFFQEKDLELINNLCDS